MKNKTKDSHWLNWCCCGGTSGKVFWGLLFLIYGAWLLAKDLGYVSANVSLWPVFLILIGLWLLLKRNNSCY